MAAVVMLAAGLAAGLAACGRVAAGGGQPGAARPSPAGTATAGTAGTAAPPPGAGSASAGTGSAGPAITVSALPVSTAGPPTTVPPTLTGSVTLTAADSGTVVYLRIGQTLTVVLTASFEAWHVPAVAGTALRRISASGGYPGKQPARAVFLAVAPGTAVLTDESDTACLHAHPPCEVPQQLWQVTVRVTGG